MTNKIKNDLLVNFTFLKMEPCIKEILCRPYHWDFKDRELDERGQSLCIDAWCLDRENEPVLLRIEDFPVLCMVELPSHVNGSKANWTAADADLLMSELSYRLKKCNPTQYKLRHLKKIYYFKGRRRYPFLQCFFSNIKSMYDFKYALDNNPITTRSFGTLLMRVWETDITPVRKLLTARNIQVCQWIKCIGEVPEEKISTCEQEYIVKYGNLVGLPKTLTKEWYTYPRLLAYDIECFSSKKASFPRALILKDCTFLISCITQRVGKLDTRKRYAILWGDCNEVPKDKLKGCEVIKVTSEMKLYEEFGKLVNEYDPEIFTGYNINRFDAPYITTRLDLYMKEWPNMSRIPMEKTKIDSKEWSSRAFGKVTAALLQCQGRITFDLYPYADRQFKLPKYDLDTVSRDVLGRGKHDVSPQFMFDTHALMQRAIKTKDSKLMLDAKKKMDKVLYYCIEDSELVLDIFEKVNVWVSSVEFASVSGINIQDLYVRGQQISSFSLIYNKAVSRGCVINHVDIIDMDMSGGFVRDPVKGLHDNVFDVDFTSLYPSIIISENMDYTSLLPPEMNDMVNEDDDDFSIIEFEQEEEVKKLNPDGTTKKEKIFKHYKFKFFKGEILKEETVDGVKIVTREKGIVPSVLIELLGERKKVKDEIKALCIKYGFKLEKVSCPAEKNRIAFLLVVLDKIQLALKIRANSLFGFFGAKKGRLPLVPIAACVTAVGRKHINKVDTFAIEERGCQVVYNDTDSSFIKAPHIPTSKLDEFGKQFGADVSKLFPEGVDAVWEKSMRILCLKKKKYAYLLYDKKGVLSLDRESMGQKGIMTARRDNCEFARRTYGNVLWDTLIKTPVYFIIKYILDQAVELLSGKIKASDLVIIRKMGSVYKNNTYFMKIFSDRMKALGRPIEPGERVGYIVIKNDEAHLLGDKMITFEMYEESVKRGDPYQIDYHYYLEKQLQSHVDQVIEAVYADELKHIEYQGPNGCKKVFFSEPIAFMCKMLKYNIDIKELTPCIEDLKPLKPKIIRRK